jgi:UDP-glucose 4-epimerase
MRAIVTGGAGFIGSHVAKDLLANGHQVLVIDDLSGGFMENIPSGADFLKVSVNDNLDEVFNKFKPDWVYHLAAYAAEGLSHHIPMFNYHNNVLGTVNVLNAAYAAQAKHFVFTSSIAAYGHPHGTNTFDESTPCFPCDPYGTAKLACEFHIQAFKEYYGKIDYTIFRPHNVFGANQNIADPYRNVVGIFINRAMNGLPMPVFGDGNQTRSFSYVDVVAQSIASAPVLESARNQIFNIGGDEPMSVKDLAGHIAEFMQVPVQIEWLPYRKEVAHAHCSHEKAMQVFAQAYAKPVSITEGLKRMIAEIKDKPVPPPTECPSPIEIFDSLPPSWAGRLNKPTGN